jgi:hypothetical protein
MRACHLPAVNFLLEIFLFVWQQIFDFLLLAYFIIDIFVCLLREKKRLKIYLFYSTGWLTTMDHCALWRYWSVTSRGLHTKWRGSPTRCWERDNILLLLSLEFFFALVVCSSGLPSRSWDWRMRIVERTSEKKKRILMTFIYFIHVSERLPYPFIVTHNRQRRPK